MASSSGRMAALSPLADGFRDLAFMARVWPDAMPGQKRPRSLHARPKVPHQGPCLTSRPIPRLTREDHKLSPWPVRHKISWTCPGSLGLPLP
jgi:hypothetical protein